MSVSTAVAGEWPVVEDDVALVEAAKVAPAAFADIYRKYAERIFLYVRTRTGTEEDAVDVTQQVFVNAFRALPRYKISSAPLSSWLFRIARNAVVDHHRRRRPTSSLDAMPVVFQETAPDPEESAIRSEDADRLRAALVRLDAEKRDLLALRYAGGLRISEIAAATGTGEEATKKRLSRALSQLRSIYEAVDSQG